MIRDYKNRCAYYYLYGMVHVPTPLTFLLWILFRSVFARFMLYDTRPSVYCGGVSQRNIFFLCLSLSRLRPPDRSGWYGHACIHGLLTFVPYFSFSNCTCIVSSTLSYGNSTSCHLSLLDLSVENRLTPTLSTQYAIHTPGTHLTSHFRWRRHAA